MRKTLILLLAVVFYALLAISNPAYGQKPKANNQNTAQSTQSDDNTGQAPTGGPKIFFPETVHDFGTVMQGEEATHKFVVKNVGDAPLKLIKAKGS